MCKFWNHELHFNEIGKPFTNNSDSESFNKGTEVESRCEESCSNRSSTEENIANSIVCSAIYCRYHLNYFRCTISY